MKIFENKIIEGLSKVNPLVPMIIWFPLIILFLIISRWTYEMSLSFLSLLFLCGLFLWTALEYFLHRFVFHFSAKSKQMKRIVFILHGNHHVEPNDVLRGLMPPLPAAVIALCVWAAYRFCFSAGEALSLLAGTLFGYLLYDYLHFSFHNMSFRFPLWKKLRNYHFKHHAEPYHHFGVSSPLWDLLAKVKVHREISKETL